MRFIEPGLLVITLLSAAQVQAHVEGLSQGAGHTGLLHYLTSPEHLLLGLVPAVGILLLSLLRKP